MKEFDEVHKSGVVDRRLRSSVAEMARVEVPGTIRQEDAKARRRSKKSDWCRVTVHTAVLI
jgi:hypothetical protein